MQDTKPKSLKNIEEKMQEMDQDSIRYHILENAKNFKTSWIALGRSLYSAWKDKLYKEWGYSTFDIYTAKEIGLRKQTAVKLLRSYYFLEKEEPAYLKDEYVEGAKAASIPSYESVDLLRQAKNKKNLDQDDYARIKKEVFVDGKDVSLIKKDLTSMIRQREELTPEDAYQKKRSAVVKRFLGTLKALKREMEISKLLPASLLRDAENLIRKLEDQAQ